jgi:hypothetical protein
MKVLYITNFDLPDFMNDMVFHGVRSLLGEDCIDVNEAWYMYDDFRKYWADRVPGRGMEYGRGFTLYGRLPKLNIDRDDIQGKIIRHYFDKIIYGSVWRNIQWLDTVRENYSPKDVIFIDGEDSANTIRQEFFPFGTYYKRELMNGLVLVKPINFCIPKELIVTNVPAKTQDWATVIPGDKSTYIYMEQEPYFKDYQRSYFGVTCKKGGWDCLRHYEILMNGCVPYFPELEQCPESTMKRFPKQLVIDINKKINDGENVLSFYEDYVNLLLDHTRKHLTTEEVAKEILS